MMMVVSKILVAAVDSEVVEAAEFDGESVGRCDIKDALELRKRYRVLRECV
jgi:hypothetical protein